MKGKQSQLNQNLSNFINQSLIKVLSITYYMIIIMSGYYKNYNRGYKPRYKPKTQTAQEKVSEIKEEQVETKTEEKGIQINLLEGIPCKIIPLNPEDYPKLLALLGMQDPRT